MRKFLAVIRMSINDAIIYRNDMLMWSISLIIGPLIYLIIWLAISASGGNPPLTHMQFIQYYLFVILVRVWANAWNSQIIARDIRSGGISAFLLKPISYLSYKFADTSGNKIIKGIFGISAFLILAYLFNFKIPDVSLVIWFSFVVSLFMSGVLVTLIDISIGLLAFWLDDVTSVDELNDVLYMVFSGVVVPIIVFPSVIQNLLVYLPYKYMVAFPVQIIISEVTGIDVLIGLTIQVTWLITFMFLYKFLWTKGQIKYQAYGA